VLLTGLFDVIPVVFLFMSAELTKTDMAIFYTLK
jgi:hypothetical protein